MTQLTKRQTKALEHRSRLANAARTLFSNHGYHAVGMRDIAEEAGLTTGSIQLHFGEKADVWTEAMGAPPPFDTPAGWHADEMLAVLSDLLIARDLGLEPPASVWTRARELHHKASLAHFVPKAGAGEASAIPTPERLLEALDVFNAALGRELAGAKPPTLLRSSAYDLLQVVRAISVHGFASDGPKSSRRKKKRITSVAAGRKEAE